MSANETSELAKHIAQKLEEIKQLSRRRVCVQNKLEELKQETSDSSEELNKIESHIQALKYQITECLNDDFNGLKIVNGR